MKYRSKLEGKVGKLLGADWEYEGRKIPYVVNRHYTPDFHRGNEVIEVKGFFRPGDQMKYLAVRDTILDEGKRLIFVFPNPHKPVRKGAKLTHAGWCEKHGIEYCSVAELKQYLEGSADEEDSSSSSDGDDVSGSGC